MAAHVVITKTRTRSQSELELHAKQALAFMAGHPATFLAFFAIARPPHLSVRDRGEILSR